MKKIKIFRFLTVLAAAMMLAACAQESLMPDEGKIEWAKNVRVGYLDQHTVLTPGQNIRDVLSSAFDFLYEQESQMNEICDKMGEMEPDA